VCYVAVRHRAERCIVFASYGTTTRRTATHRNVPRPVWTNL